jgi:hypothetical protein
MNRNLKQEFLRFVETSLLRFLSISFDAGALTGSSPIGLISKPGAATVTYDSSQYYVLTKCMFTPLQVERSMLAMAKIVSEQDRSSHQPAVGQCTFRCRKCDAFAVFSSDLRTVESSHRVVIDRRQVYTICGRIFCSAFNKVSFMHVVHSTMHSLVLQPQISESPVV